MEYILHKLKEDKLKEEIPEIKIDLKKEETIIIPKDIPKKSIYIIESMEIDGEPTNILVKNASKNTNPFYTVLKDEILSIKSMDGKEQLILNLDKL